MLPVRLLEAFGKSKVIRKFSTVLGVDTPHLHIVTGSNANVIPIYLVGKQNLNSFQYYYSVYLSLIILKLMILLP